MQVISVWNPWATLIILGFKKIETRGMPAPRSIIGQRIGIACTKTIKPEQRLAYADPDFQQFFSETGIDELDDLPRGVLLGTVVVDHCEPITTALQAGLNVEERHFGWYSEGRFAWHLRDREVFAEPVPVRGLQGVWRYEEPEPQRTVIPFMPLGRGGPLHV